MKFWQNNKRLREIVISKIFIFRVFFINSQKSILKIKNKIITNYTNYIIVSTKSTIMLIINNNNYIYIRKVYFYQENDSDS